MPSRPRHCRGTGSGPPPPPPPLLLLLLLLLRARYSSRGRRARKQKAMCEAVRKKGNRKPYTPSAYLLQPMVRGAPGRRVSGAAGISKNAASASTHLFRRFRELLRVR